MYYIMSTLLSSSSSRQLQLSVEETPGSLTKTLHTFLGEMGSHPGPALNPRPLFSQICQK